MSVAGVLGTALTEQRPPGKAPKGVDAGGKGCDRSPMNKAAVATSVVAVTAAAAIGLFQRRENAALRGEFALLRSEIRAAASSPASEPRPAESVRSGAVQAPVENAFDQAELKKLREDIAALRKSTQEITQFTQMAQAAAALKTLGNTESSIATKLTPAEALRNLGRATPESAAETVLWAAVGGEVEALSNAFVFTPTAREKADAWFAGLSEGTRRQYGTPEKVIALMIAKDAAGLSGMQVLGQKEVAPDNVGVRVRFGSADGKTKDDNLLMRRGNDGWQMVVPDNAVEKFARQLSGLK